MNTKTLSLYTDDPYPCSYIPEQQARNQYLVPPEVVNSVIYDQLIIKGYRRSGELTYRTCCTNCHACIPVRVKAQDFIWSRNQKRVMKQHSMLNAQIVTPYFSEEHYQLYRAYQHQRHTGGGMDKDDVEQYMQFIVQSYIDSKFIEFRDQNGTLVMLSVVDFVRDGISAVYTFYCLEKRFKSLGTFNILWQIQHTQALGLDFLYLGYYIAASAKMAYKNRFQPLEYYWMHTWQSREPHIEKTDPHFHNALKEL